MSVIVHVAVYNQGDRTDRWFDVDLTADEVKGSAIATILSTIDQTLVYSISLRQWLNATEWQQEIGWYVIGALPSLGDVVNEISPPFRLESCPADIYSITIEIVA